MTYETGVFEEDDGVDEALRVRGRPENEEDTGVEGDVVVVGVVEITNEGVLDIEVDEDTLLAVADGDVSSRDIELEVEEDVPVAEVRL